MRSAWPDACASRTRSTIAATAGFTARISEPRQLGKREQAALDVHAAVLGAARERRDHLPGIELAGRIEGALEAFHLRPLGGRELDAHRRQLLDADAVLAGDRAAHRHAHRGE